MSVYKKIEKANIEKPYVYNGLVFFRMVWEKENVSFKYMVDKYSYEGQPQLYFTHDFTPENICPLCGNMGDKDCLELSEDELLLLKEKLIKSSLKLMYLF